MVLRADKELYLQAVYHWLFLRKASEETQIYDNNTYEKGYTYLGIVGAPNEKGSTVWSRETSSQLASRLKS